MKRITTLYTNGRKFEIVLFENMYCAVEDKYIDKDGKLNTKLNGLQMHAAGTVERCVEMTKIDCEVDELITSGIDALVASIMVTANVTFEEATEMRNKAMAKEAAAQ